MNSGVSSNKRSVFRSAAIALLLAAAVFALSACGASDAQAAPRNSAAGAKGGHTQAAVVPGPADSVRDDEGVEAARPVGDANGETAEETTVPELKMKVDGRELTVTWEENESVRALLELASASPITVEMSAYGGFEQVGSLGTSIPRNDEQITAQAGDVVLYSGAQIVVFYGSNSWAYTRLGRIEGMGASELKDLLGSGSVEPILFTE